MVAKSQTSLPAKFCGGGRSRVVIIFSLHVETTAGGNLHGGRATTDLIRNMKVRGGYIQEQSIADQTGRKWSLEQILERLRISLFLPGLVILVDFGTPDARIAFLSQGVPHLN